MSTVIRDAREAWRQLWRAPAFTFGVILVLGISASATATALSLLNAVAFRRLPLPAIDRLIQISALDDRSLTARPLYFSTFNEIRSLPSFDAVSLFSGGGLLWIEARGVTGEGFIEAVTPGYHESLGLVAHLGRFINDMDAPADSAAAPVAVISYRFWQRYFAGSSDALGESLLINKVPFTIIGVMPPAYSGIYVESSVDFAVPLGTLGRHLGTNQYPLDPKRPLRADSVIARLRPGYTLDQARSAMETVWPVLRMSSLPPGVTGDERKAAESTRIRTEPLAPGISRLRTRYADRLYLSAAVALALLLIAALNIAGLMGARAVTREQEFATHLVLGAGRGTLVRRIVLECLWLAMLASIVGLSVAWWLSTAVAALLWDGAAPLELSTTPDATIVIVSGIISLAAAIVMSIAPAIGASRLRALPLGDERTMTRPMARFTTALVVAQVSLSIVLVVLAGSFTRTLLSLRDLDPGIDGANLRWTRILQQPGGYRGMNDASYYPELVRTIATLPGISAVALSHHFPAFFNFGSQVATFEMRGSNATDDDAVNGMMESISPGFFDTIGIPVVTGRDFTWDDDLAHRQVVIINQSLSAALFRGGNPIGRYLRIGDDPSRQTLEIVGTVRDATMGSYRLPHQPVAFRPKLQEPRFARAPVVVFRTALPAIAADKAVGEAVSRLGREYLRRGYSFNEQQDVTLFAERLTAAISSGLAAMAALLAGIGLFAQLHYAVGRRTREMGVRAAVGANRLAIVWIVLRQGLSAAVVGSLIGLPTAVVASRFAQTAGLGASATPGWWLASTAMFFITIAFVASLWPAWRAASADPAITLRRD